MKKLVAAAFLAICGCSPKAEYSPETVDAYQADDALRARILASCAGHATEHRPFATQADTQECQKAAMAQGNLNYAEHVEKERQANARVAAEINKMTGSTTPIVKH